MYKIREISDKECKAITKKLGIEIINKPFQPDPLPVIKIDGAYIDTASSYIDKRYFEIIDQFKGKVLILGLGFGCAVINGAQKKEVECVDVVESNDTIIKLHKIVHGAFEGQDKINIIKGNGKTKDLSKNKYNHVFIDMDWKATDEYYKAMEVLHDRYKGAVIHFIKID